MRGPNTRSTTRARSLRRRGTRAEMKGGWNAAIAGSQRFKFARQQPIGRFYVDFVCREGRLIVEVDGGQHADNPADRIREAYLTTLGYRVVRIWNSEVIENIDGVLQMLKSTLENAPHPVPLPASGGEREPR